MLEFLKEWLMAVMTVLRVAAAQWLDLYAELSHRIEQIGASVVVLDRDLDVMLARSAAYGVN